MKQVLHISGLLLLLAAYICSYSVVPADHVHAVNENAPTCHVHVQEADPSSQGTHSQHCMYCLRIYSFAFILFGTNPEGVLLTPREVFAVSITPLHASEFLHSCLGRAPPATLA